MSRLKVFALMALIVCSGCFGTPINEGWLDSVTAADETGYESATIINGDAARTEYVTAAFLDRGGSADDWWCLFQLTPKQTDDGDAVYRLKCELKERKGP